MRLIVEHEDGRRVGVEDISYDHPSGNPYNNSSNIVRVDSDEIGFSPARPASEHVSLKAEGFKVTMAVDDEGHERELTAAEKRKWT